jgi:O-antigen/teichoic acid export membrane protein
MRINMTAAFVGTIGTLLLAWLGWGALSLAIGSVANSAVVTISLLLQGAPSRLGRPSLEKMREVLAFGGPLTAANVITSISIDINDLAVGKLMGFKEVAIISRGQGLMNLFHRDFMGAVRNVVFPAFSQANRDGEPMEVKYIATVTAVTVIAWPFYGFMSLFPLDVIRLMFGTQWDAAAAFVPFFCIAGAFSATINLINPLLLALGHSHLVSLAEFILQPIKAITLTAVIFYFKELRPFAIAFLAIAILAVPYTYYFKQRRVPTDFGLLGKKLGTNLLITGACLFPAGTLAYSLRNGEAPLAVPLFLACAVLTFAAWIACLVSIDHPLYQEGRQMMQRRRKNAVGAEPAV